MYFESKGLKKRVTELIKFLDSLEEDTWVDAKDIMLCLQGTFGPSEIPDEIQTKERRG